MNKILIINPFGIGDVLFTTPMISNLRRAYPQACIAYIGNRRTADFLSRNAKINRVFVYERDEFFDIYKKDPLKFFKKWWVFVQEIRKQEFDVVFDLSLNSTFGFICRLCGIPKRIGYDYRGRGRFLTNQFPLEGYEGRHVVEYYLDLLRFMDIAVTHKGMEFFMTDLDEDWAKQWLKNQGIDSSKPVVAVVPGGGASWGDQAKNKRWPAQKYVELTDKIIAQCNAAVILMGDVKEEPMCLEIARLARFHLYSVAGKTSLVQMASLFKQCGLVIANDGGPLHVAVASGVRTVSIFGPVDETVYGPYPMEGHVVIKKGLACQPCYRRFRMSDCKHLSCLQELSVEDVFRKVNQIL